MEPSFLLGFSLPKGGEAKRAPDRSYAGRINFEASCHRHTSENFLLHSPSDDVSFPILSSGVGFTLIHSMYLPISARVPLAIVFPLIATATITAFLLRASACYTANKQP